MSESITKELRRYAWDCPREDVSDHAGNVIDDIADRIDARFDRELQAKQDEIADLQARLDASILPPVDIDGKAWTCDDVDKSFSLTDGDKATEGTIREIAYAWPRDGWFIVDQYDTHYPADKCRHVAPEPPETIEDILRDADVGPTKTITEDGTSVNLSPVAMRIIKANKRIFAKRGYIAGFRDGAGEGR